MRMGGVRLVARGAVGMLMPMAFSDAHPAGLGNEYLKQQEDDQRDTHPARPRAPDAPASTK